MPRGGRLGSCVSRRLPSFLDSNVDNKVETGYQTKHFTNLVDYSVGGAFLGLETVDVWLTYICTI